jgi:predicted nucleotidyltransferase component of viral defense system
MKPEVYNSLRLREIFHLEFLRRLGQKVAASGYALKGGVNLRFFFGSVRYSEDMDLDVRGVAVARLRETVVKILESVSFQESLMPFGVERVVPPSMAKAKQTETTQRFKVHLITSSGEDLFTKVEFSRRGFKGTAVVETVAGSILRSYQLPPLLIPHYDVASAVAQKIDAIVGRSVVQARDIFDLYVLIPQCPADPGLVIETDEKRLAQAHDGIEAMGFEQFRDTVVAYLSNEDQRSYSTAASWDEIKLVAADFIARLCRSHHRPHRAG